MFEIDSKFTSSKMMQKRSTPIQIFKQILSKFHPTCLQIPKY